MGCNCLRVLRVLCICGVLVAFSVLVRRFYLQSKSNLWYNYNKMRSGSLVFRVLMPRRLTQGGGGTSLAIQSSVKRLDLILQNRISFRWDCTCNPVPRHCEPRSGVAIYTPLPSLRGAKGDEAIHNISQLVKGEQQ